MEEYMASWTSIQELIQARFVTCKNSYSENIRSPERLQSQDYSYPSDIWSLGVVVFEMATGEHPFPKTDSPIEIQ